MTRTFNFRSLLPASFSLIPQPGKLAGCVGLLLLSLQTAQADHHGEGVSLQQWLDAGHRSAANIARNESRNPVETLEFFGLEQDMSLIEINPGGGWYAEILAPYLRDSGQYYAAHFSPNSPIGYHRPALERFEAKLNASPEIYGKVTVRHLYPPQESAIGPAEGADMALTFRNVHNWIMSGQEHDYFAAFFASLKPGGILGVVEHRAPAGSGMDIMRTSGYVTEDYVKELAAEAGFEFVDSAEINANPRDTKDYAEGVWTLPPTFQMGDTDRARYAAIGESDRMTLKFRKPE